jgi:hypothetical protein
MCLAIVFSDAARALSTAARAPSTSFSLYPASRLPTALIEARAPFISSQNSLFAMRMGVGCRALSSAILAITAPCVLGSSFAALSRADLLSSKPTSTATFLASGDNPAILMDRWTSVRSRPSSRDALLMPDSGRCPRPSGRLLSIGADCAVCLFVISTHSAICSARS